MRVLHFITELGLGCTAKTAVNFCIGLHEYGFNVKLFSMSGGSREGSLQSEKIDYCIGNYSNFCEMLENFKPDIIHFHDGGLPNNDLVNFYQVASKIGKVVQTNIFGGYSSETDKYINLRLFVSNATYVKYLIHGGKFNTSNSILYNPVFTLNNNNNKNKNKKIDKIIIGRIARPDVSKWDPRFEQLLGLLTSSGLSYEIHIVGAPEPVIVRLKDKKYPIKFISELVSNDELTKFYNSIDLLLHMSLIGESFGCVFVEAMSHGVPIVTNTNSISKYKFWSDNGQVEIIDNGVTGLVCKNLIDMRNAIMQLQGSPFDSDIIYDVAKNRFEKQKIYYDLIDNYKRIYNSEIYIKSPENAFIDYKVKSRNIYKTPFIAFPHRLIYLLELISVSFETIKYRFLRYFSIRLKMFN